MSADVFKFCVKRDPKAILESGANPYNLGGDVMRDRLRKAEVEAHRGKCCNQYRDPFRRSAVLTPGL